MLGHIHSFHLPKSLGALYWKGNLTDEDRQKIMDFCPDEVNEACNFDNYSKFIIKKHTKKLDRSGLQYNDKDLYLSIMLDEDIVIKFQAIIKEVCKKNYNEIIEKERKWSYGLSLFSDAIMSGVMKVLVIADRILFYPIEVLGNFINNQFNKMVGRIK